MRKTGGQLFSYLGTQGRCDFLSLFACDFVENQLLSEYFVVNLQDNEQYLDSIKKDDKKIATFEEAKNTDEYFNAWRETYAQSFTKNGIFESDVAAYTIGKEKFNLNDLKIISNAQIQKIYHEFATILRHHAIGNYENTFYILCDLILCKIADELKNKDNLQFFYKGVAYDNPLDYCDRLLNLYEWGKKELFNTEVVNYKADIIDKLFDKHQKTKNGLKADLEKVFKEQKFYNIKKFNFLSVENADEFMLNFNILVQVANLIQDFYITKSENNQFLGDLFEGFLNRSVQQTEGRFFTPTPITNFIIHSLPSLESAKVLDFACGAGHFLTEYANLNKNAILHGLELNKELSSVAKISLILHDENQLKNSHILFQNALKPITKNAITLTQNSGEINDYFNLIISNPPYSVKGFLSNLSENERAKFSLSKYIDDKSIDSNNSIECFFIERATQLLEYGGIFSLVLPTSTLNKGGIYEKTREILLNNFELLNISELNSRTFGSTGTQTLIITAKKVTKIGKSVVEYLKQNNFNDKDIKKEYDIANTLKDYCDFTALPYDDFKAFLSGAEPSIELLKSESFSDYESDFNSNKPSVFKKEKLKDIKEKLFKQSSFYDDSLSTKELRKLKSDFERSDEINELKNAYDRANFLNEIRELECEKLQYFQNSFKNDLMLLKSPPEKIEQNGKSKSNKAETIAFLGYDWSKRKGDEGIKYQSLATELDDLKENENDTDEEKKEKEALRNVNSAKFINTPLFNPQDKNDKTKLAYAMRGFIDGTLKGENLQNVILNLNPKKEHSYKLALVNLANLIDFKKAVFNKAIILSANNAVATELWKDSKFELVKLGELITENPKSKIQVNQAKDDTNGIYPFFTSGESVLSFSEFLVDGENIFLSTGGNAVVKFYDGKAAYSTDTFVIFSSDKNKALTKFLFYIFSNLTSYINTYLFKGIGLKHLQKNDFRSLKIPLPPLEVQESIIKECEEVERKTQDLNEQISTLNEQILQTTANIKGELVKLGEVCEISRGASPRPIQNFLTNDENGINWIKIGDVAEGEKYITKTAQKITQEGADKSKFVNIGDFIISNSMSVGRPYVMKITGCIHDGWLLMSNISPKINKDFLYYVLNTDEVQNQFRANAQGSVVQNLNTSRVFGVKIPLPPIETQQKIIAEIEKIESKIATLKAELEGIASKKEEILRKYLF